MPRTYNPVIKKTRRRVYSVAAVANALKALGDGGRLKDVSNKYGIPISILSDLRANKHPKSLGGQTLSTVNYRRDIHRSEGCHTRRLGISTGHRRGHYAGSRLPSSKEDNHSQFPQQYTKDRLGLAVLKETGENNFPSRV